jgi:hypothetical protein
MTKKEVVELAKKARLGREILGIFVLNEDAEIDDLMEFVKLVEERLKK